MVEFTELVKEDFEKVLEKYDIGEYVFSERVGWAFSNFVYFLKTTRGNFVLKIFRNSDKDFVKFQVRLMNFLIEKGLPVSEIVKAHGSRSLSIFKNKCVLITEFVESERVERVDDVLISDIARKHALMSEGFLRLKLCRKYSWRNHLFEPISFDVGKFEGFDVLFEDREILRFMRGVNRNFLRESVVHGNFCFSNFLVKNDRLVGILDFDDAHEDIFVYDLAVFIASFFVFDKGVDLMGLGLYLREFGSVLEVNEEEREAMYYFVKRKLLFDIASCVSSFENKDGRLGTGELDNLRGRICYLIGQYRSFCCVCLDDFLGLF